MNAVIPPLQQAARQSLFPGAIRTVKRIPRDEMLDVVARIARAVRVPVTADLEAGYGTTVKDMAETVKAAIDAGAIGMNLEDVTGDDESSHVGLPLQVEKIRAIRETSKSLGVPFVLNARTDVYLMPIGPEATRFERPLNGCAHTATPEPIACLCRGYTTAKRSLSW